MKYIVTADTDIGISKNVNQDSVLVKHGNTEAGEVILAVICDGMGGLARGEVASATVIREFSQWFDQELSKEIRVLDMSVIAGKWELMLKDLNVKILQYGKKYGITLGTTFSGVLIVGEDILIMHVGDSRVYHIGMKIQQLTEDQTVIARDIKRGIITAEEAKTDKRRNMLLQCVGASKAIVPESIINKVEDGSYLICSDGFRHEVTQDEIFEQLHKIDFNNKGQMHQRIKYLIETVKTRGERDNISAVLIKGER